MSNSKQRKTQSVCFQNIMLLVTDFKHDIGLIEAFMFKTFNYYCYPPLSINQNETGCKIPSRLQDGVKIVTGLSHNKCYCSLYYVCSYFISILLYVYSSDPTLLTSLDFQNVGLSTDPVKISCSGTEVDVGLCTLNQLGSQCPTSTLQALRCCKCSII